jgi:hypothetical protein
MQDCQSFSDLAGFLALFEIDDEAHPGSRGQGEILLRDTQLLAGGPDQLTDLRRRVSQSPNLVILPYGNIVTYFSENTVNIPVREQKFEMDPLKEPTVPAREWV